MKIVKKGAQSKKELREEKERNEILAKSSIQKGKQLELGTEGVKSVKEVKVFATSGNENPEKKYQMYYKGIQRLLKKHLPAGKENKKARGYIYEEKNTFLTRGKRKSKFGIRGADGRMGYISDAEEVLNLVAKWVVAKGTMMELFNSFREMNVNRGYGEPIL